MTPEERTTRLWARGTPRIDETETAIREANREGQAAMLVRCVADCKQTRKNFDDAGSSEQALGALLCWQSLCHVEVE